MTELQTSILRLLRHNTSGLTASQLGKSLGLHPSSVLNSLRSAERQGFVERIRGHWHIKIRGIEQL